MEALPYRQRSSTSASAVPNGLNPSLLSELQELVVKVSKSSSSSPRPPTIDFIRVQCQELQKIRQILIDTAATSQTKDAFRHCGGFNGLIGVLRPLCGIYTPKDLTREDQTQVLELMKACLDVLSETLRDHSGNRRFFAKRVEDGGWQALEQIIADIGVLGPSAEAEEGQEHLFGLLLAFALSEEAVVPIFRSIKKEDGTTSTSTENIAEHLRRHLTGKETLQNAEIVPCMVSFCKLLLKGSDSATKEVLARAVILSLKELSSSSIRNNVAMHGSGVLSLILPLALEELEPSSSREALRELADILIGCGISELDDARCIFRKAATSEDAANFLQHGLVASRTPPFIQFDLSQYGYSSIELPTLGQSFPPASPSNGYTFAGWIRVDSFDPDIHTTLFGAYDASQTCFILTYLEKDSHQFILQTSLKPAHNISVRFRSVTFKPGLWYHIALVHRRPKATSSSRAALFVNGEFVEQAKCQYPSLPPPTNTSTESFASLGSNAAKNTAIEAFLGTPQNLAIRLGRDVVSSRWSLASFHLWQDALSDEHIVVVEKLGPRYNGNFQDCLGGFQTYRASAELNRLNERLHPNQEEKSDIITAIRQKGSMLSPESRLYLSFLPAAVLDNEDRNHVNEARLIKSLSKDAARMMQRLIRAGGNSVIINGAIPSFNEALTQPHGVGILTGNPVVLVPQALDDAFWRVAGSAAVSLRLIELARTKDAVLRATDILFKSVEASWRNSEAMERENGFGVLAGILREKLGFGSPFEERGYGRPSSAAVEQSEREELALELLRLILRFVGYDEEHPENSLIINPLAYRVLLVDFDTWRRTPIATQKLYYSQFVHFASKSVDHKFNTKRLVRMREYCPDDEIWVPLTASTGIVKRFIDALKGENFNADVFPDFLEAFITLFKCNTSGDNLRSVALFITYALQDSRAFPYRARSKRTPPRISNGDTMRVTDSERSTPRSLSPGQTEPMNNDLSRHEIGIQVLEAYSDILCDSGDDDYIKRFAKTVTNKWLLFLLDESDPRVVFLASKILVRLLVSHGPPYVKKFAEKSGGFTILKQRLKVWWNMPSIWVICFALLFGHDVSTIDFDGEFNHFNLADLFGQKPVYVVYPEAFTLIIAMLEHGLRSIVQTGGQESRPDLESPSPALKTQSNGSPKKLAEAGKTRSSSSGMTQPKNDEGALRLRRLVFDFASVQRMTNEAEILQTIVRFLTDLHLKWPSFREFAASSSYTQDLLFVLYPMIVTSDSVSAETELQSRGSGLNFEGQDVVIRPHATSENQRPPVVRTTSIEQPPSPSTQRATPFRRGSSFILVSQDREDNSPTPAKFHSVISPTSSAPVSLRIGNSVVDGLLQVILAVFLDQILERKEFPGFGLFLKVPPGFQEHQAYFESYVLNHTMSTLSNTIRLNQKVLTETRVITNTSRYCTYMAEAIFEGWFLNGADPLLDFLSNVLEYFNRPDISSLKNVRLCSQQILNMRTVFLRILLLQLSELDATKDVKQVVSLLSKMKYWQPIMFSAENSDHNFLRLLFYLLYFSLISPQESVRTAAVDFWRMLLLQKFEGAEHVLRGAAGHDHVQVARGFLTLPRMDNDGFLIWADKNRLDLDNVFFGTLSRYWDEFVTTENTATEETARTRITKRKERLKVWHDQELATENAWRRHESSTNHWRNNVYSAERLKHQRALQDQQDNLAFMAATLEKIDRTLKGPCALFEDEAPPKLRLDETEAFHRMRLRTVPDRITQEDDYQPKRKTSEMTKLKLNTNVKIQTSKEIVGATPAAETPKSRLPVDILEPGRQRASSGATEASLPPDEEYEIIEDPREDEDGFEDKNRKVMRTMQHGEVIQHVSNVSRIVGLEAYEGLLIIGRNNLYLIDNYFQRADGEVVGVWQAPSEERDPYLQMIAGRDVKPKKPRVLPGEQTTRHWRWPEVMLISKRRFLFRDVALEIFFTDGRSYLLTATSHNVRNDLYNRLVSRSPLVNDDSALKKSEDSWRLESIRHPEEAPQSFGTKFANVFNTAAANPATRKWMRGEISNFAYLMLINTMAGRTFNDLTQYPVFPWVIADYKSEELDLSNPRTFRDLSKPMGCQIPSREAEFRERYHTFAEMDSSTPPFHYGTHYSSAMIVSSYLIRLQPFVQSYLLLQGGNFDHADRLFYSIEKAWHSASRDNMTDVRELTPEFFYLPDFLVNTNGYNFGAKQQTGEQINDVILPPWAKGDPHIFIKKHREALESPYVSLHLHKWIDLIFGFKQRGDAAIEATNVFHHLSYHGAKDLDSITDPVERLATIGIIHNFGQTPHQVFSRPHPQREETSWRTRDLATAVENLGNPSLAFETPDRVGSLLWHPRLDRVIHANPLRVYVPPTFDKYVEYGYADCSLRFFATDSRKLLALFECIHLGPIAAVVFVDSRTMVTAGADAVVTIWTVTYSKNNVTVEQRTSLFGHCAPVTGVVASKAYSTLLSCDAEGRVLMWDLNRCEFVRELVRSGLEVRCVKICASTGDIALAVGRRIAVYGLNGREFVGRDTSGSVAGESGDGDDVTALAWYDRKGGEWSRRNLIFSGHESGTVKVSFLSLPLHYSCDRRIFANLVQVWNKTIGPDGNWALELVKRLECPGVKDRDTSRGGYAPIMAVLPLQQSVFVADDEGRVVSFEILTPFGLVRRLADGFLV